MMKDPDDMHVSAYFIWPLLIYLYRYVNGHKVEMVLPVKHINRHNLGNIQPNSLMAIFSKPTRAQERAMALSCNEKIYSIWCVTSIAL